MDLKKTTRREFLLLSATGIAGAVLAACAAPAATTAPAAPAAATAAPAAANATPTPIATQAATATSVPTAAAAHESPMLADLVKAGKLPPLEQRLPKVPLTLAPVDGIGKFGGRLRTYYQGTSWTGHFQESQYGHSALRWIDDGLGVAPGICDTWSANADNSEWTLHFREGLKWSDGQPAGVDDVLFAWNDLCVATDPSQPDNMPEYGQDANGKLVTFTKVDDYTLKLTYGTPAPLTAKRLAMWVSANIGRRWIAPMHYLKQFVPKYNPAEKDFKDFNTKASTFTNPDMPSLNSWVLTKYDAGKSIAADRNPYYYCVDTQGNQLPYIDGYDAVSTADHNTELLLIRQGAIDFYLGRFSLYVSDIATLQESQDAGNYDVYLWDSGSGTAMMYFWNFDTKDDKLRALYRMPQFKQAMSYALDRPTIQKNVYFGTGILTTGTMSPKAFEFNFNSDAQAFGKKARDIYSAYDPDKAGTMLDAIGCKKGADGFRTYPDGSPLTVRVDVQADAGKECTDVLEIAKKNWTDVGLNVVVNQVTPTAFDAQWDAGTLTLRTNWEVGDGPDHLLYPSWVVPNEPSRWAPLCGGVLQYAGTKTATIDTDKNPWDRKPPRFIPTDKDYVGTPVEAIHKLYAQAILEPDEVKRASLVWQMWTIHEEQGPFFIGTVANYPLPTIVGRKITNVPKREQLKLGGFVNPWIIPYPAVTNPETYSFV